MNSHRSWPFFQPIRSSSNKEGKRSPGGGLFSLVLRRVALPSASFLGRQCQCPVAMPAASGRQDGQWLARSQKASTPEATFLWLPQGPRSVAPSGASGHPAALWPFNLSDPGGLRLPDVAFPRCTAGQLRRCVHSRGARGPFSRCVPGSSLNIVSSHFFCLLFQTLGRALLPLPVSASPPLFQSLLRSASSPSERPAGQLRPLQTSPSGPASSPRLIPKLPSGSLAAVYSGCL